MTNELAERDEQINELMKAKQDFENKLKEKENMMKQDNMARLQLGKRLEQVLMDKEEALEQLEQLKVKLFRSSAILFDKYVVFMNFRPNWTVS
jgi:chromosome segregation ATPase